MAIEFAKKTEMKPDDTEAVVENSKLPLMGAKPLRASAKGAAEMDVNAKPGKGSMPAAKKGGAKAKAAGSKAKKGGDKFPDQVSSKDTARKSSARKTKASATAAAAQPHPEGSDAGSYLRMRVRVENGEMSVLDVREVDGPLAMPGHLPSGFAYEVTLGAKRVAVGGVPDLGEWRGYPSPKGPPELHGHHVTQLSEAEFNVRVPREEVSLSALPQTEITLYQVKEPAQNRPIPRGLSLQAEFTNEIREVARLKGINVDSLSKDAQKEFRRALK